MMEFRIRLSLSGIAAEAPRGSGRASYEAETPRLMHLPGTTRAYCCPATTPCGTMTCSCCRVSGCVIEMGCPSRTPLGQMTVNICTMSAASTRGVATVRCKPTEVRPFPGFLARSAKRVECSAPRCEIRSSAWHGARVVGQHRARRRRSRRGGGVSGLCCDGGARHPAAAGPGAGRGRHLWQHQSGKQLAATARKARVQGVSRSAARPAACVHTTLRLTRRLDARLTLPACGVPEQSA